MGTILRKSILESRSQPPAAGRANICNHRRPVAPHDSLWDSLSTSGHSSCRQGLSGVNQDADSLNILSIVESYPSGDAASVIVSPTAVAIGQHQLGIVL
jgi:hypothetical protein